MAPLEFDPKKKGYFYTHEDFRLPFEDNQQLLLVAALLNKMAEKTGLSEMREMRRIKEAVGHRLFKRSIGVLERISCEFVEIEPVAPDILEEVFKALDCGLDYYMRYIDSSGRCTEREIRVLRLHAYQGKWYIGAFCFMRGELRLFHTARILELSPLHTKREIPRGADMENFLYSSYGIFKGKKLERVEIEFFGPVANIVREQRWHKDQEIRDTDQGILMTIPVTDYQEIKNNVLKFGNGAKVVGPPEFKEDIAEEIRLMHEMYRKRD
jgi:predicted DNA-binding transcriptional regulator YafY